MKYFGKNGVIVDTAMACLENDKLDDAKFLLQVLGLTTIVYERRRKIYIVYIYL